MNAGRLHTANSIVGPKDLSEIVRSGVLTRVLAGSEE